MARRLLPLVLAIGATTGVSAVAQDLAPLPPGPETPQPVSPDASQAEAPPALAALINQVSFWRAQRQPERAMRTVELMLQSFPAHPAALATAFDVAAQVGDRPAMQGYRSRLAVVAPNDPRLARFDSELRASTLDQNLLREARGLASAGRNEEAVARYRSAFGNGPVPEPLALEYYRALAGSGVLGYREALPVLRRMAAAAPNDLQLQVNVAEIMTYRELARIEGMERLRALTRQPEVAEQARRSWRLAISWLGPTFDAQEMLDSYLAQYPSDRELEAKREEFRRSLPDEAQRVMISGYGAFNAGDMATAEREFLRARAMKPQDTEAIVALAAVRKQQGRTAEANALIQEAIRLAPDRRDELLGGPQQAAAIPVSPSLLARRALAREDLERADGLARRALETSGGERIQGLVVLAQVAMRRNDLPTAEARYREALALRPNMDEALSGLYDVLQRQNRIAEADTLRQQTGLTPWSGTTSVVANRLQQEANETADPAKALSLLQEAQQADPANPWIRLDQARVLKQMGAVAQRRRVEGDLVEIGTPDALYAAALIASEDQRDGDALRAIERVPARLRSSDMTRLFNAARLRDEALRLESIARAQPGASGTGPLVAMAARRDLTGQSAVEAVGALGRLNQGAAARAAAGAAMNANPGYGPSAIIQLAGALMGAREPDAAAALLRGGLDESRLTDEERRQLRAVTTVETITEADRLAGQGEREQARRRLDPLLREAPQDPSLIAADARLRMSAGRPGEAREIAEALLERDPGNMEARMLAVYAAMAQGRYRTAQAHAEEARKLRPEDPQILLIQAQLARARGDYAGAQRGLEAASRAKAAQQRAQGQAVSPQLSASLASTIASGRSPADPLVDEILRERRELSEEAAARLSVSGTLRSHNGTGGLGRLTEVTTPVELNVPGGGLGGRFFARATPVGLDAGKLSAGSATEYGSNPLAASPNANKATSSAYGVGLQAGYSNYMVGGLLGQFNADAGTTPLGFRQTNFAGGAEIAPALTDNLRLRITGERRAVTDSLLSYAGARDSETGRSWGGVMRTGLRAQLEYKAGDTLFYGGGAWWMYRGQNVAENTAREIMLGANHTLSQSREHDVILGLDLRYAGYDRNLRYYTLGQGGYFSPQSSFTATSSLAWRQRWGDWETRLGGSLGWQTFREDASKVFPTDATSQAALIASGESGYYDAMSKTGVVGGLNAAVEYDVTQRLTLGISGRYNSSGVWSEGAGLLYARYRIDPYLAP